MSGSDAVVDLAAYREGRGNTPEGGKPALTFDLLARGRAFFAARVARLRTQPLALPGSDKGPREWREGETRSEFFERDL